jgi:hypothetical protein
MLRLLSHDINVIPDDGWGAEGCWIVNKQYTYTYKVYPVVYIISPCSYPLRQVISDFRSTCAHKRKYVFM